MSKEFVVDKEDGEQEQIAIIGMSCRFPGAQTLEEFWDNLMQGMETITYFSDKELIDAGVDASLLNNPNYVKAKGVIKDSECFDASFFGFTPREAEILDPQHRVFLECAWHALEDAGYCPEKTKSKIGIFGGTGTAWYLSELYKNQAIRHYASGLSIVTGNDKDFLTTRVSYKLNLKGSSINVQSACSTSLVAIVMGMNSLFDYHNDMVLAGGVSIVIPEKTGYLYEDGGLDSPDGHCRTFDEKAHGTVFSSGAGVVLLKRLSEAIRDGDNIYCTIRSGAINNDGAQKVGYTAPSVEGQRDVEIEALESSGINPDTISYVEAHGTATQIGDPIEVSALTEAFQVYTNRKQFCSIGSVKTNIGHTDVAAGVASVIKVALMLRKGKIPPMLHFAKSNPKINFEASPFYIDTQAREWAMSNTTPRRALVNSFGVGGTNACIVLEERPPQNLVEPSDNDSYKLILLSAKTEAAIHSMKHNLYEYIKNNNEADNLGDIEYTLQDGRHSFSHRYFVVVRSKNELLSELQQSGSKNVFSMISKDRSNKNVVFMFPGQGNQYINMGRELYFNQPLFRKYVDEGEVILREELHIDLLSILFPVAESIEHEEKKIGKPNIDQTIVAQPAIFIIEYALAQLLMSWGIKPQVMIGHSVGEYVAASLSGVFKFEDALKIVAKRGQLIQNLPPGAMIAVNLAEPELVEILPANIEIAAINSPKLCVVSGPIKDLCKFEQYLKKNNIYYKKLSTSHAFHSKMMLPMKEAFTKVFDGVELRKPIRPFVSTVTGSWITEEEAQDYDYWVDHAMKTVRFSDSVLKLLNSDIEHIFIEVGPGHSLGSALKKHENALNRFSTSLLAPTTGFCTSEKYLAIALGKMWLFGMDISWKNYTAKKRRRVSLPGYPFEREKYMLLNSEGSQHDNFTQDVGSTNIKRKDIGKWFYVPVWKQTLPLGFPYDCLDNKEKLFCWVVFIDNLGLGKRIVSKLRERHEDVYCIYTAEDYKELGDGSFSIKVDELAHYDRLFSFCKNNSSGKKLKVIHLWNVDLAKGNLSSNNVQDREKMNFYSLLFAEQAIVNNNMFNGLSFVAVANGVFSIVDSDFNLSPEKALAIGPCRVFQQEYPMVQSRFVDIDAEVIGEENGSDKFESIAKSLIMEALLLRSVDTVVAYRQSRRWLQIFEPVYLSYPSIETLKLRKRGVYLITGGLGGMGLVLADFLVKAAQTKLVIIHKTALPERAKWDEWLRYNYDDQLSEKINRIRELETKGAEILLYQADISDFNSVCKVIEDSTKRLGKINGVFHSAGVAGGGVIPLKNPAIVEAVFAPKVKGSLVLDEALKDIPLDFFILFSSITAILGESGQVDYCSANSFMDSFAYYRNSVSKNGFTMSMNWSRWGLVGMGQKKAKVYENNALKEMRKPNFAVSMKNPQHVIIEKSYTTNDKRQYEIDLDAENNWAMNEHLLMNMPTLVGTTFFDLLYKVIRRDKKNVAVILQQVVFVSPLISYGKNKKMLNLLFEKEAENRYKFVFRSQYHGQGEDDSSRAKGQEHAFGNLLAVPSEDVGQYDINSIIGEMKNEITQFSCNTDSDIGFLSLGERWECIEKIYTNNYKWLAKIVLSYKFLKDLEEFPIHPAMLDVATSFCVRYVSDEGELYLPHGYSKVTIHAPLEENIYSYVHSYDRDTDKKTVSFDIKILSSSGKVLLEIEEYILKQISANTHSAIEETKTAIKEAKAPKKKEMDVDPNDIFPDEGVDVLYRIFGAEKTSQLIVSSKDFLTLVKDNICFDEEKKNKTNEKNLYPRPSTIMTSYVAPSNNIEHSILEIWQNVIGINKIGVNDNFMELGGNSLTGIQIGAGISDLFAIDFTIEDFNENQTISELANLVIERIIESIGEEKLEEFLSNDT